MENLHFHRIVFSSRLFFLIQLASVSFLASSYTLSEQYFINCGSDSDNIVNGRNFVGDVNSGFFTLSASSSSSVQDTNPSTSTSPLYHTARIFRQQSWYELQIVQNGTYIVRFHFYVFPSPHNLSDALVDVSASGFSLLSNFSVKNRINLPVIEEFMFTIDAGKFRIYFKPSQGSSSAFVNAIEAFLAPESFPDSTTHVTPAGRSNSDFNGLLSNVLHVIHRINVGGPTLTRDNDTLWRNWVPDDDYLSYKDAAKNSTFYTDRPKYQNGGATKYVAPDLVYKTAKELNIDSSRLSNFFNITWRFSVSRNATHLVRVHFCDIISSAPGFLKFNLYFYSNFSQLIDPNDTVPQLAAPFYFDLVVDSDDSGFMSIGIGPRLDSPNETAFLNGLEIMEIVKDLSSIQKKKHLFIIIGSTAGGGLALIFILVVMLLFGLKRRKAKPVETFDWRSPVSPLYGGSSYSRITAGTSPLPNLNLGLKIPFAEIQNATNNFDTKLMIGEGGFGKVYKGTLANGMNVAVKRSESGHGQGLPEFQTEILVLSKIRHRHLVSLIGYCDERSEMILVYEFMEKGTLRDHLYNSNEDSKRALSSSTSVLSWDRRLEICIGAAKGLHYLHTGSEGGIIHRDVKSTNILLDEHYVAKVADFGISKSGPLDKTHISTEVKGSFGYFDPEYFRCMQLTQKSDVYSFGVVLLEVLCVRPVINRLLPWEQVNLADWGISWQKKGQLEKIVDPLLVGKINPNSLRKFGETVEKCLKEFGIDRPDMSDVLWDLEYALKLQQTTILRYPHEDSTTDVCWELLQLPVVRCFPIYKDELQQGQLDDDSDTSYLNASGVFSQLKIDDAR